MRNKKAFSIRCFILLCISTYSFAQHNSDPIAMKSKMDSDYRSVCNKYTQNNPSRIESLYSFLDKYPDSPYDNRIYALIGSSYFSDKKYDEALALFKSSKLQNLGEEERDKMTYQMAICYLKIGNIKEAAIWFETVKETSSKYRVDCIYYISYIRYSQQRYEEALKGFTSLLDNNQYKKIVPYYIAEIYLQTKQYNKAEAIANNYLTSYPTASETPEMHRILGNVYYEYNKYYEAMGEFEKYLAETKSSSFRRDALYIDRKSVV